MSGPRTPVRRAARHVARALSMLGALLLGVPSLAADAPADATPLAALRDCRIPGVRGGVLCGAVDRALDPDRPDGPRIRVEFVVVPALARNKLPDPVFMLAGGPGQSAISLIPQVMPLFSRLQNRRDIVFVDQRGTGRSAPLACQDPEDETLAEQSEPDRQQRLIAACKSELLKRPYLQAESDLGFFSTWIAVRDLDAVRAALGADRIDLVGGSYGTRVGLEYLRQFPTRARRSVLDGVAPPDMVLPASFSTDNASAWRALVASCAASPACAAAHPRLDERFTALLAALPRAVAARHPLTGREERFVLTRDMVLSAVLGALYSPALASALPEAVDAAARGDLAPLIGISATATSRKSTRLALGMHLSVVCAEDVPRLDAAADRPGADFGDTTARQYRRQCAQWPRGPVPAAFYSMPPARSPVLLTSGGADPVTPPRHAERAARALGPMAKQIVVANAGHGVMSIGCMRDVVFRFIDAATDAQALAVDASCAGAIPRPPAFVSVGAATAAAPASSSSPSTAASAPR